MVVITHKYNKTDFTARYNYKYILHYYGNSCS